MNMNGAFERVLEVWDREDRERTLERKSFAESNERIEIASEGTICARRICGTLSYVHKDPELFVIEVGTTCKNHLEEMINVLICSPL